MEEEELSEYEQLRARNIARNQEVMRALGLVDSDVRLHNARKAKTTKKKRPPPKRGTGGEAPSRRSARLQGVAAESSRDEAVTTTQEAAALSEVHAAERDAHNRRWAGHQGRATIVGTASYEHTLMRVRTMTEQKLWQRLKAIERAKGQHAVVKMRLFARVAFLEGLEDLAEAATEALQRLIEALGDVGGDETIDVRDDDPGDAPGPTDDDDDDDDDDDRDDAPPSAKKKHKA